MGEPETRKPYDLEERTAEFARVVRSFVKRIRRTLANLEDARQLIRASGSVGANCVEANESLGKRDFQMRIKICRKEAKEARYWLALLDLGGDARLQKDRTALAQEATELVRIFSAIAIRSR